MYSYFVCDIDIKDFNINEENNKYKLVATSTENETIHNSSAQYCVPCDCSSATGCNSCKYKWDLQLGRSTWRVKLTNKRKIIIRPSNGSVTKGTWECRNKTSSNGEWKHAHIFENGNGYLTHQIYLAESCKQIANVNIECRKTNGTLKMQIEIFYCVKEDTNRGSRNIFTPCRLLIYIITRLESILFSL